MPNHAESSPGESFQTFGACLAQWMERQGLNGAQLTALTGQKSRTTVARLLRDECSPQRCAAFLEELKAAFPHLPTEEWDPFMKGLEASQLGSLRAAIFSTFDDLVFHYKRQPMPEATVLNQLLDPLLAQSPCEGICFGCVDSTHLSSFYRALVSAPHGFTLRHYVPESAIETVCTQMAELFPLLTHLRYELFIMKSNGAAMAHAPWQNALILRQADGTQQLILPCDAQSYSVFTLDATHDFFAFYESLISQTCRSAPFRQSYSYNTVATFGCFLEDCLTKEKNRAIYYLKPDIGTEYMPTEVLADSLRAPMECDFQELQPLYTEMRQLYVQRFRNLYTKRKPTYLVLCPQAMEAFAQTGVLSDQPFCLRPFTPEERLAALEHLILQAEKNPFFHLHLLKEGVTPSSTIIAYDRLCVLTCAPGTDYNPSQGYSEMMLSSPGFVDCYRDYFLQRLIPLHTETPQTSLRFLKKLKNKLARLVKEI